MGAGAGGRCVGQYTMEPALSGEALMVSLGCHDYHEWSTWLETGSGIGFDL